MEEGRLFISSSRGFVSSLLWDTICRFCPFNFSKPKLSNRFLNVRVTGISVNFIFKTGTKQDADFELNLNFKNTDQLIEKTKQSKEFC